MHSYTEDNEKDRSHCVTRSYRFGPLESRDAPFVKQVRCTKKASLDSSSPEEDEYET